MIKLVFFDWNGTILSDTTATLEATNNVFALFNIKPITIKKYQNLYEVPITKLYFKVGINEKLFFENHSKINETFHSFYEKRIEYCRARAGANVLLRWLHTKGIKSVILSNHTVESIERNLKRLKLEKYVDTILANDNVLLTGLKDKTKRAEDYVKENGLSTKQILIVGDSSEEAKIARQLGVKSVLVAGGYCSEKRLKEAKPDYIIGRLDKLIEVINNIQKV
jgi:phosphoglycolate phosphatase